MAGSVTKAVSAASAAASASFPAAAAGAQKIFTLDRSIFNQDILCVGVKVFPKQCHLVRKALGKHVLRRKKVVPIINAPADPPKKLILLNPELVPDGDTTLKPLPEKLRQFLSEQNAVAVRHTLSLTYLHLRADEVLRKILPSGMDIPSSFSSIGHIAHVNLRDEQLPYKKVIGQVLLDKNSPQIRTVVNKTGTIENVFRTFPMEVLAGDSDTRVTQREGRARFCFDFKTVYWNSRLGTEHGRFVKSLKPTDVLCDMMAGVGPFSIPAALRGCTVYANDLNPESHKYLQENIRLNKVQGRVTAFNMCAREFARVLMADMTAKHSQYQPFNRVVMNLPATCIEFLDVFRGGWPGENPPQVTVYCFSKAADFHEDVVQRVEKVLECSRDRLGRITTRSVRDVSPNKLMVVINFTLHSQSVLPSDAHVGEKAVKRKLSPSKASANIDTAGAEVASSAGSAAASSACRVEEDTEPCAKSART